MELSIKIARKEPHEEGTNPIRFQIHSDLDQWFCDFERRGIAVSLEGDADEVELLYEHLKRSYSVS